MKGIELLIGALAVGGVGYAAYKYAGSRNTDTDNTGTNLYENDEGINKYTGGAFKDQLLTDDVNGAFVDAVATFNNPRMLTTAENIVKNYDLGVLVNKGDTYKGVDDAGRFIFEGTNGFNYTFDTAGNKQTIIDRAEYEKQISRHGSMPTSTKGVIITGNNEYEARQVAKANEIEGNMAKLGYSKEKIKETLTKRGLR